MTVLVTFQAAVVVFVVSIVLVFAFCLAMSCIGLSIMYNCRLSYKCLIAVLKGQMCTGSQTYLLMRS